MTKEWNRFDSIEDCHDCGGMMRPSPDGEFVRAEDAINREAVNADKIRLLEIQLKESRLRANRLDRLLSQKNQAIVEIRNIVQQTFDIKE